MSDSSVIKKLVEIENSIDSLQNYVQTVSLQTQQNLFIQAQPFIGVLIGGLLAYLSQYLIKKAEVRQNKESAIRNAIAKIEMNISLIRIHLSEIAYLQIDSRYQYYLSETYKEQYRKERALAEHYEDYKFIANHKITIAQCIGVIQESITTFFKLKRKNIPDEIKYDLEDFIEFVENEIVLREPFDIGDNKVEEKLDILINDLKHEYISRMSYFDGLRSILRKIE